MDTLSLADLVQAIIAGNTRQLARTPDGSPTVAIQEDVEMTLLALGYKDTEIAQAMATVGRQTSLAKTADAEIWIREAIAWLSQEV